jgi:trimethylamine:corrinoid methyltransferase-like protein
LLSGGLHQFKPAFFCSAAIQARSSFESCNCLGLKDLMARWRAARDKGATLDATEQAELDQLIEMEVRAATERAAALLREVEK